MIADCTRLDGLLSTKGGAVFTEYISPARNNITNRHPIPDNIKLYQINYVKPDRHIYTIICLKYVCLSVSVLKLQVAILARSSREMSITVRIV